MFILITFRIISCKWKTCCLNLIYYQKYSIYLLQSTRPCNLVITRTTLIALPLLCKMNWIRRNESKYVVYSRCENQSCINTAIRNLLLIELKIMMSPNSSKRPIYMFTQFTTQQWISSHIRWKWFLISIKHNWVFCLPDIFALNDIIWFRIIFVIWTCRDM